jgi:hypothetical protein
MEILGITGVRRVNDEQQKQVRLEMLQLFAVAGELRVHVGDAAGVDFLAWRLASIYCVVHNRRTELPGRVQGAERSARMVRALAAEGGVLHAWPNKPAPEGLTPARSWPKGAEGSGTWGTIALAVGLGLEVVLHPLVKLELPEWLTHRQTVLIGR